jgi:hypothetical protein
MKTYRSLPTLFAFAALLLVVSPAYADQSPTQPKAQLPATGALQSSDEYKALVGELAPLEVLGKKKRCKATKGGKSCVPATLNEADHEDATASVDSALEELQALVETRAEDRASALEEWSELRSDFLTLPLEDRYDSVASYNAAWLEGGYYTCYAAGDLNNCPAGVASGSEVELQGRLEVIASQIETNAAGLLAQARGEAKGSCSSNRVFGDAAIAAADKQAKKIKNKKKRTTALTAVKKLRDRLKACQSGAAGIDDVDLTDLEAVQAELEDSANAQFDNMEEDNDLWKDSADSSAERVLDRGTTDSEREIDKQDRADEVAYDKVERRATRALDRVAP